VQLLTKFQRLYPHFCWCSTQRWLYAHHRKLFSAANPRWRPPNRIYFYLNLGMILFDQMLPNQRRRRWCYLLFVDFTALYGYHNSLYLYICIYIAPLYWLSRRHKNSNCIVLYCICICIFLYFNVCISGLAAAILDFPMHSNINNKDISTSESAIPETELWLANYSWLIVLLCILL